MRISQYLLPLVDYFIPPQYRGDEERLLRTRIFVSALWALLALVILIDLFNLFVSDLSTHNKFVSIGITLPIIIVFVLCAFLLRQFAAYQLAVNIVLLVQLVGVTIAVFTSGGPLSSTATFMMFVPPMLAFCLAGTWSGVFWAVLSYLLMTAGALMEISGVPIPDIIEAGMRKRNDLLNVNVGFVTLTLIIGIYEFNTRRLNRSLKRQRTRFEYQANHDALTGLPNRLAFFRRCDEVTARSQRHGTGFAIAYVDLDGFKPVNDRYGHRAGDTTLVTTAHRLQELIRKNDFLCRLGGDEFAFIFEDASSVESTNHIVGRLHETLSLPIAIDDGVTISIRASVGIAAYPSDGVTIEQLCHYADQRMYDDKLQHRSARLH